MCSFTALANSHLNTAAEVLKQQPHGTWLNCNFIAPLPHLICNTQSPLYLLWSWLKCVRCGCCYRLHLSEAPFSRDYSMGTACCGIDVATSLQMQMKCVSCVCCLHQCTFKRSFTAGTIIMCIHTCALSSHTHSFGCSLREAKWLGSQVVLYVPSL